MILLGLLLGYCLGRVHRRWIDEQLMWWAPRHGEEQAQGWAWPWVGWGVVLALVLLLAGLLISIWYTESTTMSVEERMHEWFTETHPPGHPERYQ